MHHHSGNSCPTDRLSAETKSEILIALDLSLLKSTMTPRHSGAADLTPETATKAGSLLSLLLTSVIGQSLESQSIHDFELSVTVIIALK